MLVFQNRFLRFSLFWGSKLGGVYEERLFLVFFTIVVIFQRNWLGFFKFPIKCAFQKAYLLQDAFLCLEFDVDSIFGSYHPVNLGIISSELIFKETETLKRVLNHYIEKMELFGLGTIIYYLRIVLKNKRLIY